MKSREAQFCNLKLFLVYLVVYGHWIEPKIGDSQILLIQYKIIYLFHMPLFAFLSGLFLKKSDDCIRQIKKMLPLYILLQTAAIAVNAATDLFTPCWILWYLLSYCTWLTLGWLWFRVGNVKAGYVCLTAVILIGALAGYIPWLDRAFSGSRTVVFFPYFFAGLICRREIQWQDYRRYGVLAFAAALCGVCMFVGHIPAAFLYQAEPFSAIENGFAMRLLCYGLGGLFGFSFLTFMPGKRFPFTKAGGDTLPAYLLHGPAVLRFRKWDLPWTACMILSAALIYVIYKVLQWKGALYSIIPANKQCSLSNEGNSHARMDIKARRAGLRMPRGSNTLSATGYLTSLEGRNGGVRLSGDLREIQ